MSLKTLQLLLVSVPFLEMNSHRHGPWPCKCAEEMVDKVVKFPAPLRTGGGDANKCLVDPNLGLFESHNPSWLPGIQEHRNRMFPSGPPPSPPLFLFGAAQHLWVLNPLFRCAPGIRAKMRAEPSSGQD